MGVFLQWDMLTNINYMEANTIIGKVATVTILSKIEECSLFVFWTVFVFLSVFR